ncbi:uncharacterized protein ACNLHF_028283 isoform 3-T3 [Anomaloglossus baeobatrachus]
MVDHKAMLSLLLVAGFHLSHPAPVDNPKPPQAFPTNIHNGEVLATIPTIPTQKPPSVLPTVSGGASNAPVAAGGNLVSSTTPRLVGSVTGVKSTASPVVVTSRPDNNSSKPLSPSNGSVNGHNVPAAGASVTPRADIYPSTFPGPNSILNGNNRNISTYPIQVFTNAQPPVPASSGIRPPVVNGPVINPCPDQCPNGIVGNPPCICAIPLIQV